MPVQELLPPPPAELVPNQVGLVDATVLRPDRAASKRSKQRQADFADPLDGPEKSIDHGIEQLSCRLQAELAPSENGPRYGSHSRAVLPGLSSQGRNSSGTFTYLDSPRKVGLPLGRLECATRAGDQQSVYPKVIFLEIAAKEKVAEIFIPGDCKCKPSDLHFEDLRRVVIGILSPVICREVFELLQILQKIIDLCCHFRR